MNKLDSLGIKTIINLRAKRTDTKEARETDLILVHIPIQAKAITNDDILATLRAINQSKKPALVHCLHGSDRTGAVIAAYRMVNENWTREAAISEFLETKYGYHQRLFPNVLELLENMDVEMMRRELKKP